MEESKQPLQWGCLKADTSSKLSMVHGAQVRIKQSPAISIASSQSRDEMLTGGSSYLTSCIKIQGSHEGSISLPLKETFAP